MIRHLLSLLPFVPRFSFPLGHAPAPLIRQGRIFGVRATRRFAHKHRNRRGPQHA